MRWWAIGAVLLGVGLLGTAARAAPIAVARLAPAQTSSVAPGDPRLATPPPSANPPGDRRRVVPPAARTGGESRAVTSSSAWGQPPAPLPSAPPPPGSPAPGAAPNVAFRLQGGLTSGVLGSTGAGVAFVGVARWSWFQAEVGGRYHTPRDRFFFDLAGSSARVGLFEIDGRGCAVLDKGKLESPFCVGLSGGRWSADPNPGTAANPTSQLWVGAHVLLSVSYELDPHLALWAGGQGTISIVRPELRLDPELFPDAPALTPGQYGVALEAGIEVRLW